MTPEQIIQTLKKDQDEIVDTLMQLLANCYEVLDDDKYGPEARQEMREALARLLKKG